MKKIRLALILMIASGLTFTSCNKDNNEDDSRDFSSVTQLTSDEINVDEVTEDAFSDVENLLSYKSSSYKSAVYIPCNATIDSTAVVNDSITIYINYNGLSCDGRRLRTGQVQVKKQAGTNWGMPGASVNIRFINFNVTRVLSGKSVTINGNKTFTNLTGGYVYMLGSYDIATIIHRVTGSMEILFDNGTTRSWNVARQRTFTGTPGELVLTTEGFGETENYSGLVYWGTNRAGENFYTQVSEALVYMEVCDWNPVSGVKTHQIPGVNKSSVTTFGFDSNNQPVSNGDCPTHYRVDWQNGTYSGTVFLPLP